MSRSAYEHIEFVAAVCGDDIYSCTCGVWYITRWARRAAWNGQTQWASQCFWVWENSRQADRQDEFRSLIPPDQGLSEFKLIYIDAFCVLRWFPNDFARKILWWTCFGSLLTQCHSVKSVECRTMHPCLRQSADLAQRSSTRIEWMHCIFECSQNVYIKIEQMT